MTAPHDRPENVLFLCRDTRAGAELAKPLRREGIVVDLAEDCDEALALAAVRRPKMVLVDSPPPESAIALVRRFVPAARAAPTVVITEQAVTASLVVEAASLGTVVLPKPFEPAHLFALYRGAMQARRPVTLARVVWNHINMTLESTGGNVTRAAQQLGIDRWTLQRNLTPTPPSEFATIRRSFDRRRVRAR